MNPIKKLKAPCPRCPYKLGLVKTLVDPCPTCKANGYQSYKTFTENTHGKVGYSKEDK